MLPGISTEQLRSRLNRMVADGMLTRKRYREVPPRVDYELTERARELSPVLGELARWGYEWAWGPPRHAERVDVGAIFRLIPGLLGSSGVAPGSVELVVSDGREGEPASYLVSWARPVPASPRTRAVRLTPGCREAPMHGCAPSRRPPTAVRCGPPATSGWHARCSMLWPTAIALGLTKPNPPPRSRP